MQKQGRKRIVKKLTVVFICYMVLFMFLPFLLSFVRDGEGKPETYGLAWGDTVKVYNHKTEKVMLLNSFDYVVGVVAAEVPASYDPEALKANAIAAYTYAMRKKEYKEEHPDYASDAHGTAHVCTNYAHCKSYKGEDEQKKMWGDKYEEYYRRIASSVKEVYGELLIYDKKPALTVFYSISAGKTAACEDIWGNDVPYLKSVDSSWDENEEGFLSQVVLTKSEVSKLLSDCKLPDAPKDWLKIKERAESGYVKSVAAGDKNYTGGEIRKLFSLRSNCFEIDYSEGKFTFTVKGYGHGVGMSQTGSQYMALEGKGYREILEHYYPGTVIVNGYTPSPE